MKRFVPVVIALLTPHTLMADDKGEMTHAALSKIPRLSEFCGTPPEAPTKVRGSSPLKPLRPSVSRFVEDVDGWVSCASDTHDHVQQVIDDMPAGDANKQVVAYLNSDYEQHFLMLNGEIETFANRVNRSGNWQTVSLVVEDLKTRGCGGSKQTEVLCAMRRQTFASHLNKPLPVKPDGPVHWTTVSPPLFTTKAEGM